MQANHGQIPLEKILNTRLFDFGKASAAAGRLKELRGEHDSETEEYGITSFVYRARRPFHPNRFWEFVIRDRPDLLRAKGFFWLASHPRVSGMYSQAGGACRVEPAGVWWADTPQSDWTTDEETLCSIAEKWDERTGDRRQEIVFIGTNLDVAAIKNELNKCLVSKMESEMTASDWRKIRHPFAAWDGEIEYLTQAAHAH